jgi:integrase
MPLCDSSTASDHQHERTMPMADDNTTTLKRDLTALAVAKLLASRKAGRHRASANLYLQVKPSGAGSWLLRYAKRGTKKNCWVGLGRAKLFTLAEAKLRAARYMKMLADGLDPLTVKREGQRVEKDAKHEQHLATITFKRVAQEFMQQYRAGWSRVHADQWFASLHTYAWPTIGALPIGAVDTAAVLNVLKPIWNDKVETASRLRGRLEQVLDYAKAASLREGENPARWKGHLANMLPKPRKVHQVTHFAALDYTAVPALMAQLAERHEPAARALEFTILTAARTGETLGAQWREIDLERRCWMIPASRMKSGRPHVVPLSDAALACLDEPSDENADPVFAYVLNQGRRKPLGPNRMNALLGELRKAVTVHGFRSCFRDWAAEQTSHSSEVIEMALAHVVGGAVENAYRRTNLLAKRTALMAEWAAFCTGATQPEAADTTVATSTLEVEVSAPVLQ